MDTSTASLPTAVAAAGTRLPNASLLSRSPKMGIAGTSDNNDSSGGGGGGGASIESSETAQAAAGAAARQGVEVECRRAALATIENRRGRPAGSDENSSTAMAPFSGRAGAGSIVPAPSVASSSTIPTLAANLKLCEAFSAQSVRSGAILGYYGREEVETLFAISKNPSRIAAYNRIIKGKRGAGRDEDDGEV